MLSDVVVGTLLSATLLDLLGGDEDRRARHRLIASALAAATPTALTGLSDWSEEEAGDDGVRRAGLVHALCNSTALLLSAASMAAGRRSSEAQRSTRSDSVLDRERGAISAELRPPGPNSDHRETSRWHGGMVGVEG
ncbi:hypothetical protein OJ998_10505 [Solirubrobacter taibaiensis]|nr:hypothetical protein [Solirubrobacter taibaiensis]